MTQTKAGAPSTSMMSSGPAGLLLGRGPAGPVTVRLFRPDPTRAFLSAPEWVKWLISFRAVCLGAHVSVISAEHRPWLGLADTVRACGGTIDLLRSADDVPGQGRPYRPSLIVDEQGAVTPQMRLGAWQALVSASSLEVEKSVGDMRNSDMSIIAPVQGRTADNLRRAYALSTQQMRNATDLGESDVVCASVRRLVKVSTPPSPTEYRVLFGS
ncbi:MAG: hypothetical protein Q4P15_00840 [Propionibacteriaceae bacterium]|nr:hypothetical protein [Propionibacteriaceae bacterium]